MERPQKRAKLDFDDMVEILVNDRRGWGPSTNRKSFFVPRALIIPRSKYCKAHKKTVHGKSVVDCSGPREDHFDGYKPAFDKDTFGVYLQLLYTGEIVLEAHDNTREQWNVLKRLFDLTRDLVDPMSENLVIDETARKIQDEFAADTAKAIYDRDEVANRRMEEMLVDYAVSSASLEQLQDLVQEIGALFCGDVIMAFARRRNQQLVRPFDAGSYYSMDEI